MRSQLLSQATEGLPLADALLVLDGIAKGAEKAMRDFAQVETTSQARALVNQLNRAELDARAQRAKRPMRPYETVTQQGVSVRTVSGGAGLR